ncbi:MAG TPA: diguanylate cyclase [Gemmatimonadaceae bacterium]|nr:diguanylate cyclase [Gemmatimonadaceae bacterium]
MTVHSERHPVPRRALAISLAALAVPVAAAFWLPEWTSTSFGMLIWLTALIPAFLLSYYRGLVGVAVALAGGMAVITATQVSLVAFQIADPNWRLLAVIVSVYLAVSIGIGGLAELLQRERHAAEEMALIDRLTSLPNRRHVEIVLEGEFAAAERGRDLTVVLFDLDRFKLVNDRHGHAAGDMTLKAFAKIVRTNTRKENLSARFGGEEFLSVLRATDADEAVVFAQRVLDQMRAYPFPWGAQTASAGVAAHQEGMGSWELLLGAADRALYQAKEGGRDMVCMAPELRAQAPGATRRVSVTTLQVPEGAVPAGPRAARVYIVDDDPAVRSVLKRVLLRAGYDLWDSGDPLEVVRHFGESPAAERPDVILTDVIMPGMTGMRMIDQIAKISPDVRVIYMSGYVQSKISWEGTAGSVVAFLEKPIEMDTLLAAVDGVIRRESSPAAESDPPSAR